MPVRSLTSSVLRWPDRSAVHAGVAGWAGDIVQTNDGVVRVGYFGSYARGDWWVGSDVDLVVVVEGVPLPFERRAAAFDTSALPVPADLLVYTPREWESVAGSPSSATPIDSVVWVYPAELIEDTDEEPGAGASTPT